MPILIIVKKAAAGADRSPQNVLMTCYNTYAANCYLLFAGWQRWGAIIDTDTSNSGRTKK